MLENMENAFRRIKNSTVFMKFLRDPYFLLKYYLANFVVLSMVCVFIHLFTSRPQEFNFSALWISGLILFALPNFSLIFWSGLYFVVLFLLSQPSDLSVWVILLMSLGIAFGLLSAALMHNAAHGNFRPKWSNRAWGELCGLLQLTGFAGWTISHAIHHGNPDDPEKDAHPPGTMTFRQFVNEMGVMMKNNITRKYFDAVGCTPKTKRIWATVTYFLLINRLLRVYTVMLIFGPLWFVFFYVPFKITNALIYADFNYRTHRPNSNGDYEALNLNHNLWFKGLNLLTFGSYFHKNHHRNPSIFNPKNVRIETDAPLVTFSTSNRPTPALREGAHT